MAGRLLDTRDLRNGDAVPSAQAWAQAAAMQRLRRRALAEIFGV
jgi:hypothetical protein